MVLMLNEKKDRLIKVLLGILFLYIIVSTFYSATNPIPFIVRDGSQLVTRNTGQRFRFVGGNHFNLLVKYLRGEFYGLTGEEVFEISSEYNIAVIRFFYAP